jgi:hypothetical protein
MLISLAINCTTDQYQNQQMSLPKFDPGSFMTERERFTNWAINHNINAKVETLAWNWDLGKVEILAWFKIYGGVFDKLRENIHPDNNTTCKPVCHKCRVLTTTHLYHKFRSSPDVITFMKPDSNKVPPIAPKARTCWAQLPYYIINWKWITNFLSLSILVLV